MTERQIVILGCGYTGRRVAGLLAGSGDRRFATSRNPAGLRGLPVTPLVLDAANALDLAAIEALVTSETLVLHSIPTSSGPSPSLAVLKAAWRAGRIVYISTTGVYGTQKEVDETTPVRPESERERARVKVENEVLKHKNALVLRPAAIYGPGRGVHYSLANGRFEVFGDGSNYVSRIHVEDLAAHCAAALYSKVTGAWPVADEEPCSSQEIASFCANLLRLPLPPVRAAEEARGTRRSDRRVDGGAILDHLRLKLKYPSYRDGIPACIEAERAF